MVPIDLVHRSNTRRKACAGCVKAKRRCDLTIPACSRCVTRKLRCSYSESSTAIAVGNPVEMIDEKIFTPISTKLLFDQSSPYDSFPFPELTILDQHQVDYCVFELQRCVSSLVLDSRSAFIHPDLYHDTMPEIYQDLLSVCSLYNQKTTTNATICFRMLYLKLRKLVAASKSFTQVEDWLLAVQTLIMYQIIRIFDGDVQQKEFAEQDFVLLENWTSKLQQSCEGSWLLMESIRRTLMMSVIVRCLCRFMKDGMSTLVPEMSVLPVSENTGKWDGREDQPGPLVPYRNFVDDWNQGRVTSVDAYEMLLLKACRHAITI